MQRMHFGLHCVTRRRPHFAIDDALKRCNVFVVVIEPNLGATDRSKSPLNGARTLGGRLCARKELHHLLATQRCQLALPRDAVRHLAVWLALDRVQQATSTAPVRVRPVLRCGKERTVSV